MTAFVLLAALAAEPSAETTRKQAQRVLNAGLPFVERALAETGEFPPFGAAMRPGGLIQNVAPAAPEPDAPAEVLLEQLSHALREAAAKGEYDVVAVFSMVEVREPDTAATRNAVHVALEHRGGYCADLYYPILAQEPGPSLGEPFASPRAGMFFECSVPTE